MPSAVLALCCVRVLFCTRAATPCWHPSTRCPGPSQTKLPSFFPARLPSSLIDPQVSIFGIIKLSGKHLPFAFLLLDLIMGANPWTDAQGILMGHT